MHFSEPIKNFIFCEACYAKLFFDVLVSFSPGEGEYIFFRSCSIFVWVVFINSVITTNLHAKEKNQTVSLSFTSSFGWFLVPILVSSNSLAIEVYDDSVSHNFSVGTLPTTIMMLLFNRITQTRCTVFKVQ